jgi:hypothetical protein
MEKKKIKKFIFNPIYDKLIEEIQNKLKKIKSKKIKNKKYSYIGEIKKNLPNGWGKMVCINPNGTEGETKIGEFKNGKLNGKGYIKFKHDLEYIGHFNKDQHYEGRALWGSTTKKDKYHFGHEVYFKKNKKDGLANIFKTDPGHSKPTTRYEGNVNTNIEPHGKGTACIYPFNAIAEGEWRWQFAHGEFKVQYKDEYYEGIWKYGKLMKLTLEGKWIKNKFHILKDKSNIEKSYVPWIFKYPLGFMWLLTTETGYLDSGSYTEAKKIFNNYESGEW